MKIFNVGDIVYYHSAKRNGRVMSPSDIPLLKITEVDAEYGKLSAVVSDNRGSAETWLGKTVKNRPMEDYTLHKAAKEEKTNDLSDLDADFALSVLKNVLLNTSIEMAEAAQTNGFESDEFRLKLSQVKSLGDSIKKLEA